MVAATILLSYATLLHFWPLFISAGYNEDSFTPTEAAALWIELSLFHNSTMDCYQRAGMHEPR